MLSNHLETNYKFRIIQIKEIEELFGFETRNKYSIELENGEQIGFAAEQGKDFQGVMSRQFLGHWRPFQIHLFDQNKKPTYIANHPFRFILQRLDVQSAEGIQIGSIQQRFGFLFKKFDLMDPKGKILMRMSTPLWKIWTFPIFKGEYQVALILKKWSGFMQEAFLDADNFSVEFKSKKLSQAEKELIIITTLFIDILFFEVKASSRRQSRN